MTQELCPTILPNFQHQSPKISGGTKIALIAPLYLCMIAGSGGVYTPVNLPIVFATHPNPIFDIRGYHNKRNQLLTISQHLISIREMFGLRMSELSKIFGVSRPAAYAWINGIEPKTEIRARICKLSKIVEELRFAGINRAEILARQPIRNGQSLINLLESGGDVQGVIAEIKLTSMRTIKHTGVRREFGPSLRKRRVRVDSISTPIVADTGDRS